MYEFVDSFNIYQTAPWTVTGSHPTTAESDTSIKSFLRRWTTASNCYISSVGGRSGPGCLALPSGAGCNITLTPRSGWVVGFAINFINNLSLAGSEFYLNYFMGLDGTTQYYPIRARLNTNGTITIYAYNTILGVSTATITSNKYYYFELAFSYSVDFTSQHIIVYATAYLNGVVIISNTIDSGIAVAASLTGANIPQHAIGSPALGSALTRISDLYIMNLDGPYNNTPTGPVNILPLWPASDVNYQWNTSRSGKHFSLVNETPEDADTTYISSTTIGQTDTWLYQNLIYFTVLGVQMSTCMRKTDNGTKAIQCVVDSIAEGNNLYLNGSYNYQQYIQNFDPATSAPWTTSGFNSTPFGAQLEV